MKPKIFLVLLLVLPISCAELQQVVNQLPNNGPVNNVEIGSALRQALDNGIDKQVTKLSAEDGFYKNELVQIVLPQELQKVDKTLRDIGLNKLADDGLKIMNRAAEDAVGEAIPIFVSAVKDITFDDAKTILLGNDDSATKYLEKRTQKALYNAFDPIIKKSFENVGADIIWNNLITRYNQIPFTEDVNPNLTDYVTTEALKGVYKMIAVEEKTIRNNVTSRTTKLLQKVFALQD